MRILITGNLGYVGPCVTRRLRATFPDATLVGLDMGFFAHCLTNALALPEVAASTCSTSATSATCRRRCV